MSDSRARLYLLTPRIAAAADLGPDLPAALAAGDVACVLLRLAPLPERDAKALVKAVAAMVQPAGAALLVEDVRVATHAGADGVHVEDAGQPFEDALASLKPERIVGVGGPLSRDDAMRAGEAGADYLLFDAGPQAPADTLEQAAWWAEIFNVPCVGVAHALDEVEPLGASGAEFVALGEALWADPRGLAAIVAEADAALVRAAAQRAAALA